MGPLLRADRIAVQGIEHRIPLVAVGRVARRQDDEDVPVGGFALEVALERARMHLDVLDGDRLGARDRRRRVGAHLGRCSHARGQREGQRSACEPRVQSHPVAPYRSWPAAIEARWSPPASPYCPTKAETSPARLAIQMDGALRPASSPGGDRANMATAAVLAPDICMSIDGGRVGGARHAAGKAIPVEGRPGPGGGRNRRTRVRARGLGAFAPLSRSFRPQSGQAVRQVPDLGQRQRRASLHRLPLERGPGLDRRPAPADLGRHPQQQDDEVRRGDRGGQRVPLALQQRQRVDARSAGSAGHLRAPHPAGDPYRARRLYHRAVRPFPGQAPQLAQRRGGQVRRLDLVHRSHLRHPGLLRGRQGGRGTARQRLPDRRRVGPGQPGRGRDPRAERAVFFARRDQDLHRRLAILAQPDPGL